jgi:CheY-like chemotaxis protein
MDLFKIFDFFEISNLKSLGFQVFVSRGLILAFQNSQGSMNFTDTETATFARTVEVSCRPRILLVEDEQTMRDIVVPWLLQDGYDCREAADGRAAIDLLATGLRINLVLSNMLLPEVNGYTLLLHVKQQYPRIPFAYVTAISDAQVREQVMRDGANGYLNKPFTKKELLRLVRGVLGRPVSGVT